MAEMQNDEAFAQAMAITSAQAGVRAMTAQEVVAYAREVADGIRGLQGVSAAPAEDDRTEGLRQNHQKQGHRVRHRTCGNRQNLHRRGHGSTGVQKQRCAEDHPGKACGRSRGTTGIPAG